MCCTVLSCNADAVNAALQDGTSADQDGSSSMLTSLLPGSTGFQLPPAVTGYVGVSPKSFPLQIKHSGR